MTAARHMLYREALFEVYTFSVFCLKIHYFELKFNIVDITQAY